MGLDCSPDIPTGASMQTPNTRRLPRLIAGWLTTAAFFAAAPQWLAWAAHPLYLALIIALLFAIILWSAFGVVHEADHLAEALGEPLGTLVLTLAIVLIEVALISAATLSATQPTLGRDTMFAVLMIVLNGVVGLGLLMGACVMASSATTGKAPVRIWPSSFRSR